MVAVNQHLESNSVVDLVCQYWYVFAVILAAVSLSLQLPVSECAQSCAAQMESPPGRVMTSPPRDESPTLTLNRHLPGSTPPTPDVRLYHRAVVAPMEPPLRYVDCRTLYARRWLLRASAALVMQKYALCTPEVDMV